MFKVLLREYLQQLLMEFQLFAQLDVLVAHHLLSALPASKVSLFKVKVAYNAIRLAEPAPWTLRLNAHHASLAKISTPVNVYLALTVSASTVKTTTNSA